MLDGIKEMGFRFSTRAGSTSGIEDIIVPEEKATLLRDAQTRVDDIESQYQMGFLTADERYDRIISIWRDTTDKVTEAMKKSFDERNPVMEVHGGVRPPEAICSKIPSLGSMRRIGG